MSDKEFDNHNQQEPQPPPSKEGIKVIIIDIS